MSTTKNSANKTGSAAPSSRDIYLIEATTGADRDIFRYCTEDEELFRWLAKAHVETPKSILEQLLQNKDRLPLLGVEVEDVKTTQDLDVALDEWLGQWTTTPDWKSVV